MGFVLDGLANCLLVAVAIGYVNLFKFKDTMSCLRGKEGNNVLSYFDLFLIMY